MNDRRIEDRPCRDRACTREHERVRVCPKHATQMVAYGDLPWQAQFCPFCGLLLPEAPFHELERPDA